MPNCEVKHLSFNLTATINCCDRVLNLCKVDAPEDVKKSESKWGPARLPYCSDFFVFIGVL